MSSTTENQRNGEAKNEGLRNRKRSTEVDDSDPITLPFEQKPPAKPTRRKKKANLLGVRQQQKILEWMMQGASPQMACRKLNLSLDLFWMTLERDARFAAELQRVWDTLSFNVVAALYQAAIKGNGPAQQFWLKHRPPPRWAVTPLDQNPADDLEAMSDAELLDRARTEAPDLAAEIATRIAATPGRFPSAGVSDAADRSDE